MDIYTYFNSTTLSTLEYLITSLANCSSNYFYLKKIEYTHLNVIINDNSFFQYNNLTKIVLIKSLLNIYHFMNGDISNSNIYSNFYRFDKMVSSKMRLSTDFQVESISFQIIFGIKNGRRIYQLENKLHYLQNFYSKPRLKLKFDFVKDMYDEPEDSLRENIEMYEEIYDYLHDSDNDSYLSEDFWQELAADLLDQPTTSKTKKRKTRRGGIRKRHIKNTLRNFRDYNYDKKHYDYYLSLLEKIKTL